MSVAIPTQRRRNAGCDTWPRVRLGEVCEVVYGERIRKIDATATTYPVYGGGGETFRWATFNRENACVVSRFAMSKECVRYVKGRFFLNDSGLTVASISKFLSQEFIDWFLLGSQTKIYACGQGVAQRNLEIKRFRNLSVPLPPLAIQRRIAAKLDRLCDIVAKRKNQLSQLNQLVKSRFVEMFGDPITNPKGWPMAKIGGHLQFLTSGSRGWAKYYADDGELFITIKNVKGGKISTNDVQHVKPPTGAETERTRVQEGDLLISITADLGRTGIVTRDLADQGAYINQHLSCVRLDRKSVEPLFVAFYLESAAGKAQFEKKNQSAVKAGLNFEAIRSLRFYLPPLALQREFASFVEKVDKLAFAARRRRDVARQLYRAKIQEFFG